MRLALVIIVGFVVSFQDHHCLCIAFSMLIKKGKAPRDLIMGNDVTSGSRYAG